MNTIALLSVALGCICAFVGLVYLARRSVKDYEEFLDALNGFDKSCTGAHNAAMRLALVIRAQNKCTVCGRKRQRVQCDVQCDDDMAFSECPEGCNELLRADAIE